MMATSVEVGASAASVWKRLCCAVTDMAGLGVTSAVEAGFCLRVMFLGW